MHGREEVRSWIVPLMKQYPNDQMRYTHDWTLFDEENGCVVFCARTHMPDPGDGSSHSTTNWTRIDYAGNGLFSREEDIHHPAAFGKLLVDWQAVKNAPATDGIWVGRSRVGAFGRVAGRPSRATIRRLAFRASPDRCHEEARIR
jgi:hypothetical protein